MHVMAKKLMVMLDNKWDKESATIQKKFSGDSGAPLPSAGKRLAEEPADETAPLTFDEKRDLCASMNKLPGKQVRCRGAAVCGGCACCKGAFGEEGGGWMGFETVMR